MEFQPIVKDPKSWSVQPNLLDYDNERTARQVGKTTNAVNQLHHRALASLHRLLTRGEATG